MKNKPHKLTIKNRATGMAATAAATELFLDGKKVKYCKSANLSIKARDVAILTLELYVDCDIENYVIGELCKVKIKK